MSEARAKDMLDTAGALMEAQASKHPERVLHKHWQKSLAEIAHLEHETREPGDPEPPMPGDHPPPPPPSDPQPEPEAPAPAPAPPPEPAASR